MRWDVLNYLIDQYDIKSVVEIGVLDGKNAARILANHPSLVYIGVDPYIIGDDQVEYEHNQNKTKAQEIFDQYENAELRVGVSTDFDWGDTTFDLVFIDGDHSYNGCRKDILFWKSRVNKIISGHDYFYARFPGVQKSVNEIFGREKVKTSHDNVWMVHKQDF